MEWKEAKIFISSTFSDMHAERDYLLTEVFPELSEWCEQRRIRLTDIDLRWGVTKEDSEAGNTVRACLNSIDDCRPFFINFLGQKRGWVPNLVSGIDAETIEQYIGLGRKLGKYSITEMEIEHAALSPMARLTGGDISAPEKSRALFFFRRDPFGEAALTDEQKGIYTNAGAVDASAEDRKLAGSKEWISREYTPIIYDCRWDKSIVTTELGYLGEAAIGRLTDFTAGGEPLKYVIIREMKTLIEEEFPDNVPVSRTDRFDKDAFEQELYSRTAAFDFIGREKEIRAILAHTKKDSLSWAGGEGEALFLTAPEGMGKTALLARICGLMKELGHSVLYRSCKVTDLSMSMGDIFLSVGNEAGIFRASEMDPGLPRIIDTDFLNRIKANGYDTLILDGINKMNGERLGHLTGIPEGFHLIVSSDDPEEWRGFRFPYRTLTMSGLDTAEDRSALIGNYLKRLLRKLDFEQIKDIITAPGAEYPMYIRIVLNEIRNYGPFVYLSDKLKSFGDTPEEAFTEMLRSAESEYPELAHSVAGMLTYSRDGLSEQELLVGLGNRGFRDEDGNIRAHLRRLLRRLRPYMQRVSGRYDIQSTDLVKAVKALYGDRERDYRNALVYIYENNLINAPEPDPNEWNEVHGSRDLLYQLDALGEWDGICYAMTRPEIFRGINPEDCRIGVRNGTSFRTDLGTFTTAGPEQYHMLAEIFIGKAKDCIDQIGRLYPQPYKTKCEELRRKADQTGFYRFRNLFYDTTQFAAAAFSYEKTSLQMSGDSPQEAGEQWLEFSNKTGPILSFLQFLSRFGGDQTGLSYEIVTLADGALIEYARAEAERTIAREGEK